MCGIGLIAEATSDGVDVAIEPSVFPGLSGMLDALIPVLCASSSHLHHSTSTAVSPEDLEKVLTRRGPNMQRRCNFFTPENDSEPSPSAPSASSAHLSLFGAVLHMRGPSEECTAQPIVAGEEEDRLGCFGCSELKKAPTRALLWNGEIFGGLQVAEGANDGQCLLEALSSLSSTSPLQVIGKVQGPFAFALWEGAGRAVWFGRDRMGRRSLLIKVCRQGPKVSIILASASFQVPHLPGAVVSPWIELPPAGLYRLSFAPKCRIELVPWAAVGEGTQIKAPLAVNVDPSLLPLPHHLLSAVGAVENKESVKEVIDALYRSVALRTTTIAATPSAYHARVALLFSGGVDCMVLAALCSLTLPPFEPIDLINVAFIGDKGAEYADRNVPDRVTAINGHIELKKAYPTRKWNLIFVDATLQELEASREQVLSRLHPCNTVMDFNLGAITWLGSRGSGTLVEGMSEIRSKHCRYGGDGNINTNEEEEEEDGEEEECDNSSLPLSERLLTQLIQETQRSLISRRGYVSSARVLMVGLGADEAMGGYGRHRTVHRRGGDNALKLELEKDLSRLWLRNLGRDDRMISDWGREARHPYLDEHFLTVVRSIPLHHILDYSLPPGQGDKKMIRQIAALLGLPKAATLVKRAMQFGSRIANNHVAGYVPLSPDIAVADVVNFRMMSTPHVGSEATKATLSKRANRRRGKPGYQN